MSSRTNCFGVDLSGLADQILTVMKGLIESNIATLQEYISIYTCLRPVLSFISLVSLVCWVLEVIMIMGGLLSWSGIGGNFFALDGLFWL